MFTRIDYIIGNTKGYVEVPMGEAIPEWLYGPRIRIVDMEYREGNPSGPPAGNCIYNGNMVGHSWPHCTADACY